MAWTRPAPQPAPDVINGAAGRYPVKTLSSLDVHLGQITKALAATTDTVEMLKLCRDRTKLLELRHDLSCPLCGR